MTTKKYYELISQWNPEMVLYIRYRTKHSIGRITMSIAFFLEKNIKISRMMKKVDIVEIYLMNELTGVAITYFDSIADAWFYAIGEKYHG